MAKQANKTVIGAFVVGALALVVVGVLIFGSGRFMEVKDYYIMYFEGSVKGLNVGAPVVLRGVEIGSVKEVLLYGDPKKNEILIPVIVEIQPDRIAELKGEKRGSRRERRKNVEELIERGLRAQLKTQSMVTGLLMIQLDIYPDKPAKLLGIDPRYQEVPTIPSSMEELGKTMDNVIETLKTLPLKELFARILDTVEGIDELVNSPDTSGAIKSLHLALEEIRKFVANLDSGVTPRLEETLDEARKLVKHVDSKVDPAEASIEKVAKAAQGALKAAEEVLVSVESMVDNNSTLRYQINDALEQVSAAARSIRVLADSLEQHPESLLRGKKGESGGKRR